MTETLGTIYPRDQFEYIVPRTTIFGLLEAFVLQKPPVSNTVPKTEIN